MKKFLPILIPAVAGIVGGGGGFLIKSMGSSGEAAEYADADEYSDKKDKKKKSGDKKGKGGADELKPAGTYLKFKRQFVIPVMENGRPELLMIFDINIELESGFAENAYAYEPRLRDAMLAQLFIFANRGELTAITEDGEALDNIKSTLLETARKIMGDSAQDILLIDIGVQEY